MENKWRKLEKALYLPMAKPELVTVPNFKFFTLRGQGNPNSEAFQKSIEALYALSYCIRMMPKNGVVPVGYFEYTVYPLEGIWDLTVVDKGQITGAIDKDALVYTIMIRQPDFVTEELALQALQIVKRKKPSLALDQVAFQSINDGKCVQMLHEGPFETESETFDLMKAFCKVNNLKIKTLAHREIYLSDFRKTESSKLKTVLRYSVE